MLKSRSNGEDEPAPQLPYRQRLLTEFSAKLLRQDKIAVLKYLEKHTPVSVETIAEDPVWQPYLFYKESLAVNKG
ncbi:cohesin subunit SA-2-like protein [Aphelenchoides avenae]|nr:cohesin subunit SA-2-like protein [Aphelenchus avenae]